MDEPHGARISLPAAQAQADQAIHSATLADRLWSGLNNHPALTLLSLIAFYFLIACGQAATKLLWCDELITLAVARQGSLPAIWNALEAGTDPNPPLTHWLVLESTRLFGENALAMRLPAILCVMLAIVSLWVILRRWLKPGYAAAGILALMATRGFDYAYDARSYAPLLGFSMASLGLWLVACDHSESPLDWPPQNLARFAALSGMAAALALALSSNYYGVLAFFPIAAGEALRTLRLRHLEPGTWLALAAAALPLLCFRPLIRHNLAEFGPHAWNSPRFGMVTSSYLELVEGVFWAVLGLALYALWQRRLSVDFRRTSTLQPHETCALTVLLLYPVLGYLVALAGHGMISPRCVLSVCGAFGIAAALLTARIFAGRPRASLVVLGIALLWVTARESACTIVLTRQRTAFFALRDRIAASQHSQPIVVGDSIIVLPLAYYSSEDIRARIVFPIDFDAIHAIERDDSGEQNLWAGRNGIFPVRIVPYSATFFTAPEITVIARPSGWLVQNLTRDGYRLNDPAPNPFWQQLGGVFTPLAHEESRLLAGRRVANR